MFPCFCFSFFVPVISSFFTSHLLCLTHPHSVGDCRNYHLGKLGRVCLNHYWPSIPRLVMTNISKDYEIHLAKVILTTLTLYSLPRSKDELVDHLDFILFGLEDWKTHLAKYRWLLWWFLLRTCWGVSLGKPEAPAVIVARENYLNTSFHMMNRV